MKLTSKLLVGTALGGLAVAATTTAALAQNPAVNYANSLETTVTAERLANPEPENWLLPFQNYEGWRYSDLDQINRDTVGDLSVAYIVGMGDHGRAPDIQGAPLVDAGMIYAFDGFNRIYKIDGTSGDRGNVVWVSDPVNEEGARPRSRGGALWGDYVITNLREGRVVATDRETGEIVWDQQIAGVSLGVEVGESFTAAPLATEDYIIVGNSAGDSGSRGWLAGIDPESGEEQWRWYSIPEPGQPGAETWVDDHDAWMTGGGSFWTTGTYDAEQRLTIWGSANPVPMFDPEYRPGDNLFTNSALAVDVDSGELAWYFQYTPNGSWDFDENGVHLLYDTEVGGEMRQVVGHFGRNGFFYQLDRTSGEFINANQYVVDVNWTEGIDEKTGLPVEYDPNLAIQEYVPEARGMRGEDANTVCPTHLGGIRWQPPAYDPVNGIVYGAGADGCSAITVSEEGAREVEEGGGRGPGNGGGRTIPEYYGGVWAQSVATGEQVATATFSHDVWSGVLATAGGLVFIGQQDGTVTALNSDTLETVWSFNIGSGIKAPPISFSVDGNQYIAIEAGATGYRDNPPGVENMQQTPMLVVFGLN